MIGIDLFAGAGGMSLGATRAGVQVQIAVESDNYAASTYVENHPGVTCFVGDIRRFQVPQINGNGEQVVVFGGPPCQGFSTSNQRTRTRENPSNWLFREFMRVVTGVEPEWVVIENVSGMMQTEDGLFVAAIQHELENLGYRVSHAVLSAAEFGVPQRRSRLFIVGSRAGIDLVLPDGSANIGVSVWDAIGDLPSLGNGASVCRLAYRAEPLSRYAAELRGNLDECCNHLVTRNSPLVLERYRHVPQGGNWQNIPAALMTNYSDRSGCHTGIYHRLSSDKPSKVIGNFRKNMLIHPLEDRGLSVREAARLQSFPDYFVFKGSIGFQQQQVGNAVPPVLAEVVFRAILQAS